MADTLEYMQFATRVYAASDRNQIGVPDGWTALDLQPDKPSGFSAGAFVNEQTKEIVIAYTGTNEVADVANWSAMAGSAVNQIFDAMSYYVEFNVLDAFIGSSFFPSAVTDHDVQ